MKFKSGFISNSSSTSFIMIARELNESELDTKGYELAYKGKLHACHYGDWNDGPDYFDMTPKMLVNYLKWHCIYSEGNDLRFYDVHKIIDMDWSDGTPISREDIPADGSKIFFMDVTYHSTEDFSTFMDRHLDSVKLKDFVHKAPPYTPPKLKPVPTEKEIPREELIDFD